MEAAVVPFPMPDITPPETNMYFVDFLVGTINYIKIIR